MKREKLVIGCKLVAHYTNNQHLAPLCDFFNQAFKKKPKRRWEELNIRKNDEDAL